MHIDNYEFKCPDSLPPPNQNKANAIATDLHIATGAATVEVLGIDGIDPKAPNSPHGLGVDAQGKVEIDSISVKPGGTVRVRMRQSQPGAPGNKRLRNLKYKWTYPPGATGNETEQTLAAVILPDTDGSPTGESAIGAIRQVLHLMLRSLDELNEHQLEQARR